MLDSHLQALRYAHQSAVESNDHRTAQTIANVLAALDRERTRIKHPPYISVNLYEALSRHVFPDFKVNVAQPEVITPSSTQSTDWARVLSESPQARVFVRHHSSLLNVLRRAVRRRVATTLDGGRNDLLDDWNRRYIGSYDFINQGHVTYVDDVSGAALLVFGTPLNILLGDRRTFIDAQPCAALWQRPRQGCKVGIADWICYAASVPRGTMEWKQLRVLPDDAMEQLATQAAAGEDYPPGSDSVVSEGLYIHVVDGKVESGMAVTHNARMAVLQVWTECHRHGCRWAVLFNTRTAIVFYLADTYTLFSSTVIPKNAGQDQAGMTLAMALFGIALADEIPELASSSVDFLDLSLVPDANSNAGQRLAINWSPLDPRPPRARSGPLTLQGRGPTVGTTAGNEADRQGGPPVDLPHQDIFHLVDLESEKMVEQVQEADHVANLLVGRQLSSGRIWTVFEAVLDQHLPSLSTQVQARWDSSVWDGTQSPTHGSGVSLPMDTALDGSACKSSPIMSDTVSLPSPGKASAMVTSPSKSITAAPSSIDSSIRVIVKLAAPVLAHDPDERPADKIAGIINEARAYEYDLDELAPGYRGPFCAGDTWLAIMEDAGLGLTRTWRDVHDLHCLPILALYDRLHANGIAHGDVEPRHVRVGAYDEMGAPVPSSFKLIDFDRASNDPAEVERERREVRKLLRIEA